VAEPLRLITVDLDDTLWPCFPTIRAAEQTLYDWLAREAPQLTRDHSVESLRDHRMALARELPEIAHDLTEIRLRSLRQLAEEYGLPASLASEANTLFRRERNRVQPYDEVLAGLQLLREDYVLVALSNGNAQVENTPLAGCFHYSFMAEEVGAAKPHPALFEAASRVSGIGLRQALHVGDDPLRDIEAARRLGMATAWMNRERAAWPEDLPAPDLSVTNLEELWQELKARA
jgi:FMN hydrolase / 5-amino-6-(5-phospho-D-ribitylamino)uracil phosphatase